MGAVTNSITMRKALDTRGQIITLGIHDYVLMMGEQSEHSLNTLVIHDYVLMMGKQSEQQW